MPQTFTPTEADLIAAFIAKRAPTVCDDGVAYGVDKEADKAKRAAAREERELLAAEQRAERYAEEIREAYHAGGLRARDEVVRSWRY